VNTSRCHHHTASEHRQQHQQQQQQQQQKYQLTIIKHKRIVTKGSEWGKAAE